MTLAAVRSRKKLWKTSLSRSWTSTSASLTTRSPEDPREPDRQGQSELTARSLGEKTRSEAAADRVQFEFRDRALEPQQQPAVGRAGIVDAIAIRDEAVPEAADVKEWVPVRAVAGQPRHVEREDQADLAQADTRCQFLEALALDGGGAAQAEIGVDDVNVGLAPAEIPGALHQRVLEAEAFLVADDLGWRRLPDVDDRLARQMRRLDQLGFHGASPSARRQSGR